MAEREDERSFLRAEKAYERFSETARHALILLFSLCCLDFCGLFMDKTFIDLSKIIPMLAIPGAVIKLLFDAIRMCCHKNIRQIIILKAMLKALVFVVSYRLYTYYSVTEDGRQVGIFSSHHLMSAKQPCALQSEVFNLHHNLDRSNLVGVTEELKEYWKEKYLWKERVKLEQIDKLQAQNYNLHRAHKQQTYEECWVSKIRRRLSNIGFYSILKTKADKAKSKQAAKTKFKQSNKGLGFVGYFGL